MSPFKLETLTSTKIIFYYLEPMLCVENLKKNHQIQIYSKRKRACVLKCFCCCMLKLLKVITYQRRKIP